MNILDYCPDLFAAFPFLPRDLAPWHLVQTLASLMERGLGADVIAGYIVKDGIAIHPTARIEAGAIVKAPALIGPDCRIAAHAYLRGGVALAAAVVIGPGSEVKSSLILSGSALAHLNFVGDSVIGGGVNLEAGAVVANHWNERIDKAIHVRIDERRIATGVSKFGAVIGDNTRIGANAVLSPGTILPARSIVGRLCLIEQDAPDGSPLVSPNA
jgi:NDP-sugar pyrophosphorylase family protein